MTVSLRPMTSARLPSRRCRGRTVPGAAWVVAEGAAAMRETGLAFSFRLQLREIVKAKERSYFADESFLRALPFVCLRRRLLRRAGRRWCVGGVGAEAEVRSEK